MSTKEWKFEHWMKDDMRKELLSGFEIFILFYLLPNIELIRWKSKC